MPATALLSVDQWLIKTLPWALMNDCHNCWKPWLVTPPPPQPFHYHHHHHHHHHWLLLQLIVTMILQTASREEEKETNEPGDTATQTGTRTTLNDLYDTLRKLEEEEHFPTQRSEKKMSWCRYLLLLLVHQGVGISITNWKRNIY